jgi:peptidoglycan/xylan/chitin deacetylase (PgdA/CDA1 family)
VRDLVVLCYHAVSERWPAALSVTPSSLQAQVDWLLGRGYRPATLTDAVTRAAGGRVVVVTFDDAFRSVANVAFPLLQRVGVPATLFVPTDHVGRPGPMAWPGIDRWLGGPHEAELTGMTWEEICALAEAGWEIGSHTAGHPHLTTLDDAALADELGRSKARCEEVLGRRCRSLAYPYGDFDSRVERAAGAAGYDVACTLPHRLHAARPLAWPRVGVWHDDGALAFRAKVWRPLRRLRASAAWDLVDRPRRAVKRSLRRA